VAPAPPLRTGFAIDVPDALLARARAGERPAFEQLYRWFERPVFTLALRICGDREEAAEVLQDTMLKVLNRVADFAAAAAAPMAVRSGRGCGRSR
jgi:RNA polymerase sigma-70 factor (ECF subfamily)